jgi:hypothetical protein
VPAGKVGYTYCYNAGGFVTGVATYEKRVASTGTLIGHEYRNVNGDPPGAGAYNYKNVAADS